MGVDGSCVTSYSNGASLASKQPREDCRDSGASAAVWEWMRSVSPRTPTGRPYAPSGPGRTPGTRVYPPLCGSGFFLCLLVLPRATPIPQTAQRGVDELGCNRRSGGFAGPDVLSCFNRAPICPERPRLSRRDWGASPAVWELMGFVSPRTPTARPLCPKRPRQQLRDWGASAAVWDLMGSVCPCTPTGRPHPPNSPDRTVETQVHPPLCRTGLNLCLLVLPGGLPMPNAAQAGLEELGCIRRCV